MADLTAAILARTSGPACSRLRELACNLVDGALPPEDRDLARGHLDHCPACRHLVSGLEAAGPLLEGFAELDPGPSFTASVLGATRGRSQGGRPPEDALILGWKRLMRRPRAALEAAYLATAAGFVLVHLPLPEATRSAGSALIAQAWAGSKATLGRVAALEPLPVRRPPALQIRRPALPKGVWLRLRSRVAQRIEWAWQRFLKVTGQVRAWMIRPA
jgi:anti-sigma factor RsiW